MREEPSTLYLPFAQAVQAVFPGAEQPSQLLWQGEQVLPVGYKLPEQAQLPLLREAVDTHPEQLPLEALVHAVQRS